MSKTNEILFLLCIYTLTVIEKGQCLSINLPTTYTQIPEDIPFGTSLVNFTVTGYSVIVSLMDDQTRQLVNLSHNGNYYNALLRSPLDREEASSHILKFRAIDGIGNTRTATFQLYVTDVNDNSPSFKGLPYTFYLPEITKVSIPVGNVRATDPDRGSNATVRYYLKNNYPQYTDVLHIDDTTGLLSLQYQPDYENETFYEFTVLARDLGTPPLTSSTSLIIHVVDSQDTPPFFTKPYYRTEVREYVPIGTNVLRVHAVDGDFGVPNSVNYTIIRSNCPYMFWINSTSGDIYTAELLDRESNVTVQVSGVCSLRIMASEEQGTSVQYGPSTCATNVTIIIKDEDDNRPVFDRPFYQAILEKGSPPGTRIPLINASGIYVSDADQGEYSDLVLRIFDVGNGYGPVDMSVGLELVPGRIVGSGLLQIVLTNGTYAQHALNQGKHFVLLNISAALTSDPSHILAMSKINLSVIDTGKTQPNFLVNVNISSCPLLPTIQYGHVGYTDSQRANSSTAVYACDEPFHLIGYAQRPCLHNGTWEGQTPFCSNNSHASLTGNAHVDSSHSPLTTMDPNDPCLYGSISKDHSGVMHCLCEPGYVGLHCDQDFDECRYQPCEHSGTCINTDGSYHCVCPNGYAGIHCTETDCQDTPGFPCWEMIAFKMCADSKVATECAKSCDKCSLNQGPVFVG